LKYKSLNGDTKIIDLEFGQPVVYCLIGRPNYTSKKDTSATGAIKRKASPHVIHDQLPYMMPDRKR